MRSAYGSQAGETMLVSLGSRCVSETVTCLDRETRVTVTDHRQSGYPADRQANWCVATRSPSMTTARWSPTAPASAMLSAAARARSTAAVSVVSGLMVAIGQLPSKLSAMARRAAASLVDPAASG